MKLFSLEKIWTKLILLLVLLFGLGGVSLLLDPGRVLFLIRDVIPILLPLVIFAGYHFYRKSGTQTKGYLIRSVMIAMTIASCFHFIVRVMPAISFEPFRVLGRAITYSQGTLGFMNSDESRGEKQKYLANVVGVFDNDDAFLEAETRFEVFLLIANDSGYQVWAKFFKFVTTDLLPVLAFILAFTALITSFKERRLEAYEAEDIDDFTLYQPLFYLACVGIWSLGITRVEGADGFIGIVPGTWLSWVVGGFGSAVLFLILLFGDEFSVLRSCTAKFDLKSLPFGITWRWSVVNWVIFVSSVVFLGSTFFARAAIVEAVNDPRYVDPPNWFGGSNILLIMWGAGLLSVAVTWLWKSNNALRRINSLYKSKLKD